MAGFMTDGSGNDVPQEINDLVTNVDGWEGTASSEFVTLIGSSGIDVIQGAITASSNF